MYIDLLINCLLDNIYGSHSLHGNRAITDNEIVEGYVAPQRAHTMIGMKRLYNIADCYRRVHVNGIEGDVMECGVWRGGATILMAGLVKHFKDDRKVFVADSFEGLPPPDSKYPVDKGDVHHTMNYLAISLEQVKENFRRYGLLDDNVVFIKGFFETSLKDAPIEKLSILRLDGDMYSSTIQVLNELYDKVSPGGFIIIDDYALKGACSAVNDFRRTHNIKSPLLRVDHTAVFWVKE